MRIIRRRRNKDVLSGLLVILIVFGLACGGVDYVEDAGAQPDDDGASNVPSEPEPPLPSFELTSTSGRVSGGAYTLKFQLGHGFGQESSSSSDYQVEGATAIND